MSMDAPGYEQLAQVLQAAYDQAAAGKGAERHADGKPFHEQPMQTGSDMLGTDAGLAFQAIKKIREGSAFAEFDRFERELLGAINYIAGMVIWRRRQLPRMTEAHPRVAELQGEIAQLLVEDAPKTFSERCAEIDAELRAAAERIRQEGETIIVSTPEQHAAIYAALGAVPNADGGTVSIHFGAQPFCAECEYPDDGTGTHYATCSKLTAPKEFVEQVEATFDELEGARPTVVVEEPPMPEPMRSEVLGAMAAMETIDPPSVCPGCGREEGLKHRRGCPTLLPKPAAVEDPWVGAPEWARFKAQDADGKWWWYSDKPEVSRGNKFWLRGDPMNSHTDCAGQDAPSLNWRDTLIERP